MIEVQSVAAWMRERGLDTKQLIDSSGLELRVIEAIVQGRYTPSPEQRQRLAKVLGVSTSQIAWGHVNAVEHVYGHGPQFGRSP
jgi:ribosome-binding protein aMBF1 (putative translation factor)